MARSWLLSICATGLLAVAGCTAPPPQGITSRLSIEERSQVISYAFGGRCSGSIGSAHRSKVQSFLKKKADPAVDMVIVSVPRGCDSKVDRKREHSARAMLRSWAGPVRVQRAEGGDLQSLRGIVRIVHVEGIKVDRTDCDENLGCAAASNLAAMIDDPRDLYHAEGGQAYQARSAGRAAAN